MKVLKRKTVKFINYIGVLVICMLISGCETEESLIISSPSISVSQGAFGKEQKKEIKDSEWLPNRIVPLTASDWERSVDENDKYIFILTGYKTIMQIDKKMKEFMPVIQCKKEDNIYI